MGWESTYKYLCVHVISLHLTFAVLHGKELTAVLIRVYPSACLSLAAPGYLIFSAL